MTSDQDQRRFGAAIQQLIQRRDLTRDQACDLMREVLAARQPELHQGAFLAALAAKGETAEEIAGVWAAIDGEDTVHARGLPDDCCDNSGTGMDPVKTFNISTLAAVVAAAGGAVLARHGARALTSACGTVDLCEALGIAVEVEPDQVAAGVRTCGLGLFNGMSPRVHPGALFRLLSVIRFGSILNIAASLASPARPTLMVRGVHNPALLEQVAEVLPRIGVRRAWVVHGFGPDGQPAHDELSVTGSSRIIDVDGPRIERFTIMPEDVGLRRWSPSDLAPVTPVTAAAESALRLLAGQGKPAQHQAVVLNAAAILVVTGREPGLSQAVAHADHLISSGQALDRLHRWVAVAGDPARLQEVVRRAGLERPLA